MTEMSATETNSSTFLENLPISRFNQILVGVLLVQVLIAIIVFWPSGTAAVGEPLLGDLTADEVTQLTFTDADGNGVTLARRGDEWVLPEAGDYPALAANVTEVIDGLLAVSGDRLVTRTTDSHARLQVAEDEFVRRVELTTDEGTQTLYVGSAPSAGATHLRLADENETYLTNQINSFDLGTRVSSWIDTLYFNVPRDDVTRIELANANGEFVFTRELGEDGTSSEWTLADLGEGEELDTSTVSTLLTRVSDIRMVEPVGTESQPEYGLSQPLATVTLTTVNDEGTEETHTLTFGAQDDASNYYMQASNSDYIVRVANFTGDELTQKTRAGFLREPETSEETDESGDAGAPDTGVSTDLPGDDTAPDETETTDDAAAEDAENAPAVAETPAANETNDATSESDGS